MQELTVAVGQIVALRLFDIAYAIDLDRAAELCAGRAVRSQLKVTRPKAVAFGVAPLSIASGPLTINLDAGPVEVAVGARLYDFGAVTLSLRLPVAGQGWTQYVALVNALDAAVGSGRAGTPWAGVLTRLRGIIGAALVRPSEPKVEEDYLLASVEAFDAPISASELFARADLVALLSGEQRPLSEPARAELLRSRFSYYDDDLTVLTWDRAFIYDPRGESDVADVLEVANAQLLEMRYYDEWLDDELPRMYALVEAARRRWNIVGARRYAALARKLYTMVAEVTELTERVDNALQVTEDVFLARVYSAALELFRVRTLNAAVDRKLSIIRDTYAALNDEASHSRSELMEAAIVLLIVVELVIAVLQLQH
jgi:hypothetical protein